MSNLKAKATLLVKNGKQMGASFSLMEGDKKILGRDNSCHIQILDKGISRNHSMVKWEKDHFLLVDLGSTNGTFVNNKIVISRKLQESDIIKIGQTEIEYKPARSYIPSSTMFVNDGLERSSNTIMERVDVNHSLCISSSQLHKQQDSADDEVTGLFLSTIYEVSNLINAEQDQQKLFETIMDKIMEVFKPDRAFLVLQNDEKNDNDEFKVVVSRDLQKSGEAQLSHTILKKTIHEGVSISSANAMLDDRFSGGMSIVTQNIKSVMSVPLESSHKILGAIYVDSIGHAKSFRKAHLELLTAIGKQAGVAVERTILFEHFLEKEKMQHALHIAQDIQKSLLPLGVPENFVYDLVGWNLTCDETGGDYYDILELPNGKWGIAIGDVTGHGVGSALLMATARAFLKALAPQKYASITEMICELNNLLERDMEDDKFMTMFYGELDPHSLVLKYANAGHDSPFIYHPQSDSFESLESTGIPLGMMEDFDYEEEVTLQLNRGDLFVLSTDGITESMNPEGEQYGEQRLQELVRSNAHKSANQIIKNCYDELQKFCRGTQQRDDLTLVVIKFTPRFRKNTTTTVKKVSVENGAP